MNRCEYVEISFFYAVLDTIYCWREREMENVLMLKCATLRVLPFLLVYDAKNGYVRYKLLNVYGKW